MAGQLRHVYRYGELRNCASLWSDFWFCMRVKGSDGPVKQQLIQQYHREREEKKYREQSSEDIWQARTRKVPEGLFFNEPMDPPVGDHDEWRRTELERRRKIRAACEMDEIQRQL